MVFAQGKYLVKTKAESRGGGSNKGSPPAAREAGPGPPSWSRKEPAPGGTLTSDFWPPDLRDKTHFRRLCSAVRGALLRPHWLRDPMKIILDSPEKFQTF